LKSADSALHLQDAQQVFFQLGTEKEAMEQLQATQTTLTAWFELNAHDENARQYTYQEIPEHYTWKTREKQWKRRVQATGTDKVIGRIHAANPADQERFYLYLVLLQARGLKQAKTISNIR